MQMSLRAEVQKFIDAEVERGHDGSPSELVEHAIEALREQETAEEGQLADLRDQIAVARAQSERGEEIEYRDGAELLADIRARRSGQR
jgi:Arc/MetJ-type ribon-helix-helix transcriptional regulator